VLVRYPNGIEAEFFYQKRAPASRPDWIEVVTLKFPSGRTAEEVVPRDAAALAWMANLACLELHPHPVRAEDLEHPDELRIDLDPGARRRVAAVREVAASCGSDARGLRPRGWPKTSGSRGMHVNVRIERRWTFTEVRRAALAFAREVERRAPALATSKWWKEERHGVFLDYNQNAKDRTVAAAYSVRRRPDARVSAPLDWDEIAACEPGDFTLATMPARSRGRRSPCRHRRSPVLDRRAARPVGAAGGRGAGRCAVAAALPQAARRSAPRGSLQTPADAEPAADRDRARKAEGGRARGAGAMEGASSRRGRAPQPADVLVDAMRGRFKTWTRIRVNLEHVPEAERPPQEPLDPPPRPWRGRAEPSRTRRR
jgi:bifunctional non-homologous end joining protein LigD